MAKSIAYIVAFLAISVYFLFIKKKNDLPAAYDGKFLPEFRTVAELFRYECRILDIAGKMWNDCIMCYIGESEILLFNAKWELFHLYHPENKINVDEKMMMFRIFGEL